ncbi:hypothetical protein [Pseudidiomarina planktonica]|nr:hypothetical protein [Pseudidiomarina planktonica]RUO65569.1 hypothetical protein CWI77_03710 [Pseudidiomarina planktonica]
MSSNWQQQLAATLAQPKAAEVWQLMHELRDHLLHTPTSWYACVQQALTNSSTDSAKAFIAVLQVLRLSLVLRFQPSTQLSLMAACATQFVAIKTPTNSVWRELRKQLRNPVREQAELTRLAAFALHCSTQLCNGQSERNSWQQWLLKYPYGASWSWCAQIIEQSSATIQAEAELIPASSTPWYGQPLTSADNADDEALLQQQQNFMAPLLANYRRSLKLQAPRKLLQALRDYGAGNGQLTPLVNAISKRPGLVSAVQTEASRDKPHAAAMGLKQSLLWLGPKRVAPIVANTLLHEQLTNYHGPYHHQLLSYNQLFQQLLRIFLASTATAPLKIPVPLFCMVWNAGLFRHTKDFAHLRLSVPDTIPGWHSCHWFQPANNAASYRQLGEQIVSRWQLPPDAISQVNTEHINNSISAAVVLASAGVWACFAPHSEPLPAAKECFQNALKIMNMKEKSWQARVQIEITKQSAQCCWPRF